MTFRLLTRPQEGQYQKATRSSLTLTASTRSTRHLILQLQHMLGNRAVQGLIQTKRLGAEPGYVLQPKLMVGAAHDHCEQEADAVAHRVMTMPAPPVPRSVQRQTAPEEKDKEKTPQTKPLAASITPLVQREMIPEEDKEKKPVQAKFLSDAGAQRLQLEMGTEEEKEKKEQPIQARLSVQRMAVGESFEAGQDVEARLSRSKGGGSSLPDHVRSYMEPRFGADFSGVRVHAGYEAAQMNQAIGAQAFTHGQDIYFGAGKDPDISDLTAHELTHVVQQTGGIKKQLISEDLSIQRTCSPCGGKGEAAVKCPACERDLQRSVVCMKPLTNESKNENRSKCFRPAEHTLNGLLQLTPANKVSCGKHTPLVLPDGTTINNPVGVITAAENRANELLDSAITSLAYTRRQILKGAPISFPTISDALALGLRVMGLEPGSKRVWQTTGSARNYTAELLLRRLRSIRSTIGARKFLFTCLGPPSGTFGSCSGPICQNANAVSCPGSFRIILCAGFWQGGLADQADTIIHESAHNFAAFIGDTGRAGNASCYARFAEITGGLDVGGQRADLCPDPT